MHESCFVAERPIRRGRLFEPNPVREYASQVPDENSILCTVCEESGIASASEEGGRYS